MAACGLSPASTPRQSIAGSHSSEQGGARQYAMVGRVRLAGMELAQPAGLACAGAGLRWRLFCHHHLTPVGGIDRRHLIDLHSL